MDWRRGFIRTFLERDLPQLGVQIPASTLPDVEYSDVGVTDEDSQLLIVHAGWLLVSGSVDGQAIPIEPALVMRFGETILSFPLACNSGSVPMVLIPKSLRG